MKPCVVLVAVLAAVVLSGCGVAGEQVVTRWLVGEVDDLADLDRAQKAWLNERFAAHVHAIRGDELPEAVELLERTRAVMEAGADPVALQEIQLAWVALVDRVFLRLTPDTAEFLTTVSPAQARRLVAGLNERLDEEFADLELPPEKRRAKAEEELLEGLEDLVGELRPEQAAAVLAVARSIPDTLPAQRDTFRRQVARLDQGLRAGGGREAMVALVTELWSSRDELVGCERDPEQRRADSARLLLVVDRSLDDDQRHQAVAAMEQRIRRLERFVVKP